MIGNALRFTAKLHVLTTVGVVALLMLTNFHDSFTSDSTVNLKQTLLQTLPRF